MAHAASVLPNWQKVSQPETGAARVYLWWASLSPNRGIAMPQQKLRGAAEKMQQKIPGKQKAQTLRNGLLTSNLAPRLGLEPGICGLTVRLESLVYIQDSR